MPDQRHDKMSTPHLTEAFAEAQPITRRINRTLIVAGVAGLVLFFNSNSAAQKDMGEMPTPALPTAKAVISPSR